MVDLYEDESDLFVAGLAAGNQRVAVSGYYEITTYALDLSWRYDLLIPRSD